MTDKEKLDAIRAEIHRLVDVRGYDREMANELFTFMDSLPNEPVSEDTWEASKQYALRQVLASTDTKMSEQAYLDLRLFSGLELAVAHKDGANWQKEKMMAKAIDAKLLEGHFIIQKGVTHPLDAGNKVKVIVIKENKS